MPQRCLSFVQLIRLTAGFAYARVELKQVCGGRCGHGRAHGGLKSVEPRDNVLSVSVGRRCCVAVGLDRERCGEIRIVKLANARIINVGAYIRLYGVREKDLLERIDKFVLLPHLGEEVLAFTKGRE